MVLSSGHKIDIVGDNSDTDFLKRSLELLFVAGYYFQGYRYKNNKLEFINILYEGNGDLKDFIEIDKEDRNIDYILNLVKLYLSSSSYKKALSNIENIWSSCEGSITKGWSLSLDTSKYYEIVTIAPNWCFYGK